MFHGACLTERDGGGGGVKDYLGNAHIHGSLFKKGLPLKKSGLISGPHQKSAAGDN